MHVILYKSMLRLSRSQYQKNSNFGTLCSKPFLTPKGMGLPYVGFSDSGQADVNAINFWIF
jgi:hypothetical protein